MEIKKADSKGRVSGFTPGDYYAIDREAGQFMRMALTAPDGIPLEKAMTEDMALLHKALAQVMFKAQ